VLRLPEVTHVDDSFDAENVTGGDDQDDERLLGELRALAARHDPVPPETVLAARSAIAHVRLDAELAELVADAAVDARGGVRAVGAPILLSFQADSFAVEVELLDEGGHLHLVGQLVPPTPGVVVVRHGGGTLEVIADEVGRFAADDVARGPVSLRCAVSGRTIDTDWFLA
jgi:hypothetical protein